MNKDFAQREKVITLLFKETIPLNDNKSLIFEILEFPDSGRVAVIRKHDSTKSERHAFNLGKIYLSYSSFLILRELINSIDSESFEHIMRKTKELNSEILLGLVNKSSISTNGSTDDDY